MQTQKIVVGIDIGGTNTEVGLITFEGNILQRGTMPTRGRGPNFEHYLNSLTDLIHSMLNKQNNIELCGIGIGAPNGNFHTGAIEFAPNLEWEGIVPICKLLSQRFQGIPIKLTNDANAAALGEMLFGAARGYTDFVTITLGTGVGSGIVSNGQLVYGHDGFAGEIGHTTVYPNGRLCGCGRYGCIEAYLSASGLVKTALELMVKYRTASVLGDIPPNKLQSKDIYEAAVSGDWLAQEVFRQAGETMGLKLADVVATLSPQAFFFVGGVTKAGDILLDPIRQSLERYVMPIFKNKVKILPSGLPGIDSAILGAGALVLNDIKLHNKPS
ncbi:MAG TPA: ROK family protein [Salinivirgaceae bacterium]|nr:ROK family protein [Salinivirgaceae bacterium]